MDIPVAVIWFLVALNVVWAVFTIVVLANVLRLTNEAIPFFRRHNVEHRRSQAAQDRTAHPWAYE